MKPTLLAAAALIAIIGCAKDSQHPQATTTQVAQKENPVIVNVVSRDSVVTITSSPRGPLYSVKTDQGKLLVANATLDELQRDHADIYRKIAPAIARGEATADLVGSRR